MKPRRHRETKNLAADERGSAQVRKRDFQSAFFRVHPRPIPALCLKRSATDKYRFTRIREREFRSVVTHINPWLIFAFSLGLCASAAFIMSSTRAQQTSGPAVALEGCLKC